MSVSLKRAEGTTVLTVTFDDDSKCSLICTILRLLCLDPSLYRKWPSPRGHSQSVLGALQIMTGVLINGLETLAYPGLFYSDIPYPIGFEGAFITIGITNILSERFCNSCMVVLSVIYNLCGVALTLPIIIQYSIEIFAVTNSHDLSCERSGNSERYWSWHETTSLSPSWDAYKEKCHEGQALKLMLWMSVTILLIILECLEMCLAISSATLNIKALKKRGSGPNKPQELEPEKTNTDPEDL